MRCEEGIEEKSNGGQEREKGVRGSMEKHKIANGAGKRRGTPDD